MDRREFLKVASALSLTGCASFLKSPDQAEVSIRTQVRGTRLTPNFFGLSFESTLLSFPGVFYRENDSLIGLLRQLSDEGVIRTGGFYGQYGFWTRQREAMSGPFRFPIAPLDVDRFAGFMEELDWKVVYGLNLGNGTPERLADEAAYVATRLGEQLEAFQIGHEPDTYAQRGLRSADYGVRKLITEWQDIASAVRTRFAEAAFAGPDTAGSAWLNEFALACGPQLQFLSHHHYALSPQREQEADLEALFASERLSFRQGPAQAMQIARQYRLPCRITEGGVLPGAGRMGVSDTLGSALWGINYLFQLLALGYEGMYFHAGPGGSVSPIVRDAKTMRFVPRPLYYGMLLVRQMMPGQLVALDLATGHPGLRAYAVVDQQNGLRVVLINLSATEGVTVTLEADRRMAGGEIWRLSGAGMARRSGINFAGAVARSDAPWQALHRETLQTTLTGARVQVPAASAALVMIA